MNKSLLFGLLVSIWCINSVHVEAVRPDSISWKKIKTFSKEELREKIWEKYNVPEKIAPLRYAVDLYEVSYTSVSIHNSKVRASGLFFVPQGTKDAPQTIMYHHGTRVLKGQKYSATYERALCISFAADGYAVVMPDYFGLGNGDGRHLYLHAETEARASIDMLRATRMLCEKEEIPTGEQLFLTGYSQGGHASMATHKAMQEQFPEEFSVTANSPLAGPYDLYGVQGERMFEPYDWPSYLPFLLLSYQDAYQLFDDPSEVFLSPYDTLLPDLFDGSLHLNDIDRMLPRIPTDMIRPELIQAYRSDPNFPFRQALEKNTLINWDPQAPLQFCYCKSDEAVNYQNSVTAYKNMKKRGLKHVRLRNAGSKFGHVTCSMFAVMYAKWFFDSFRDDKPRKWRGPFGRRFLVSLFKISVPGLKKERRMRKKEAKKRARGK